MKEQRQISMSEQRNIKGGPWQSEIVETPKKPRIGRRTALKLGAAAVGGAALVGAAAVGRKILEDLGVGLEPQESAQDNFFYEESRRLAESTRTAPTPFQPQATPETTNPETSPTPEAYNAWVYDNIDLSDPTKQVDMGFYVGQDIVLVPYFTPIPFYEGALEDGAFSPKSNTGLTYLDGLNRKILNLHSGRRSAADRLGFTAWNLQKYLEEYPEIGVMRHPREVDELIKKSLVGSTVILRQDQISSNSKVVAAVRVGPGKVPESQAHVGNIVEWLATTYPDSGFSGLGKNHETLVIKFCGRLLAEIPGVEEKDPSRPDYQQSRFFVALKKA